MRAAGQNRSCTLCAMCQQHRARWHLGKTALIASIRLLSRSEMMTELSRVITPKFCLKCLQHQSQFALFSASTTAHASGSTSSLASMPDATRSVPLYFDIRCATSSATSGLKVSDASITASAAMKQRWNTLSLVSSFVTLPQPHSSTRL